MKIAYLKIVAFSLLISISLNSFAQQPKIDSLLSLIKKDKDDTNKVNHINAVGLELKSNDPDTAIFFGNQSLQLAQHLNFKKGIANAFNTIGVAYYNQGNYPEALKNYFASLKIKEDLGDKKGVAALYGNIGNVYFHQGNYVDALKNQFSDLKIAKEIGDKKGIASTYMNIGVIYKNQGNYAEALKEYFAALKIKVELGDKQGIAALYGNIGNVYVQQGNYPDALKNQFSDLKIAEEIADKRLMGNAYDIIGTIYALQGNYPDALKELLSSLKIREEIGDKNGIAYSYSSIADVYSCQNNYTDALKEYYASLKIREEIGDKRGIAANYIFIGNVYLKQNNYPEALKEYFVALKIKEEIGDKEGIAMVYNNIGNVYTKQNKYKAAEEQLNKSLVLSTEIGNKEDIGDSYSSLADVDSAMGKEAVGSGNWQLASKHFNNAYNNYKLYIIYRDSVLNEANTKKTVQQQMTYEFDKKESLAKAEQDKKDAVTDEEKRRQKMFLFSVICGLLLVVVFSVFMFNRWRITQRQKIVIEKQKHIVDEQKKIVEEKNKDITDSINYAQRIQRALLASESLLNKNLGDYFVFFKPKDIVSGDFYWATEKDGRFYLAVCDSTGHGVPGAFMSLLNISFLNEAIAEKGIKQPNEVFNHVRQRLIENISTDGAKDGMDGILVCFDKIKKEISYAGANNAPMLMNGTLQELATDNMPVGLGEKKDSFTHQTFSFQSGNILYLYSDGFADQFGGPKGKKFKYKPLNEILASISKMPMAEQRNTLEHTFVNWKGNLEQVDDVLVIGIRI